MVVWTINTHIGLLFLFFVVAARSPFLDLHCFSRVLNKTPVSFFDVSPKVTCGPTPRQLLNFCCSAITDLGRTL
jgi:hypothetical protein